MITSNYQVDGDIYSYADKFFCDSHDDKPTNADAKDGLINGAILEETDTGKTYIFDKKANEWTEKAAGGGGGGGSTTLAGLTDVDISNPADGQTLVYNAAEQKWENGSGASGGGVLALHVNMQTGALDKTWKEIYDQANAGAYCFVINSFNNEGFTGLSLNVVTSIEDQTSMGNGYVVICSYSSVTFSAQTQNDYPSVPLG